MRYGRALRLEQEILETGVPARALAIGIPQQVPDDPYAMHIPVEVHPPGSPSYVVKHVFHSALVKGPLQIGADLPVKIHPTDPNRIAVDWDEYRASVQSAGGDEMAAMKGLQSMYAGAAEATARRAKEQAASEDSETKLKKLAQMRDAGLLSHAEFEAKRTEVLAQSAAPVAPVGDVNEPAGAERPVSPVASLPSEAERAVQVSEAESAEGGGFSRKSFDPFVAASSEADRFGRIPVPGIQELALPEGPVRIFFQQSWDQKFPFVSQGEDFHVPHDLWVGVTEAATGEEVPIQFPPGARLGSRFLRSGASKYVRFGGATFRRPGFARVYVGEVEIPRAGHYSVEVDVDAPYGGNPAVTFGL